MGKCFLLFLALVFFDAFLLSQGKYESVAKVMLITSNYENFAYPYAVEYSPEALVWDLRSPNSSCPAVADYPERAVQGAAAFVYKDRPMACGGYLGANVNSKECYSYDVDSDSWTFEVALKQASAKFASVEVNGDWWIIGGGVNGLAYSDVQIWRSSLFSFAVGPSLPEERQAACAVAAGDRVYVIGGRYLYQTDDRPYLRTVWSYDLGENVDGLAGGWDEEAELPGEVRSASCVVVDGLHGQEIIVAGGRKTNGFISKNVYAFNLESREWRTLPDMPNRVGFAATVQSPSDRTGFLMLGGQGFGDSFYLLDTVHEFNATSYEWSVWEERLPQGAGRSWMMAVPLPEEYVECA